MLAREGMTEDKLATIISRQISEDERKFLSDLVIQTDVPLEETRAAVSDIFTRLLEKVLPAKLANYLCLLVKQ